MYPPERVISSPNLMFCMIEGPSVLSIVFKTVISPRDIPPSAETEYTQSKGLYVVDLRRYIRHNLQNSLTLRTF